MLTKKIQIGTFNYCGQCRFWVTLHGKGHKVKDGTLKAALSPIAICDRVASYWRGGDNASTASNCCEGDSCKGRSPLEIYYIFPDISYNLPYIF